VCHLLAREFAFEVLVLVGRRLRGPLRVGHPLIRLLVALNLLYWSLCGFLFAKVVDE